jgi:hypothetical protein
MLGARYDYVVWVVGFLFVNIHFSGDGPLFCPVEWFLFSIFDHNGLEENIQTFRRSIYLHLASSGSNLAVFQSLQSLLIFH